MFHNISYPTPRSCSFEIHGADLAIVNGIRRTILTNMPVVGFRGEDDPSLDVVANTGPLHNEFILHRFGLIPIHLDEEEVEAFAADDYVFELKVHNTSKSMKNVTTQDFTIVKNGHAMAPKDVQRIFPPNPISKQFILITRLRPGEELHVRGKAILGTSRMHAGFSPGFCTLSFIQDPAQAAHATNVLDKERAFMKNEYGDPLAFRFDIETECGLKPRYLVSKALEIMRAKVTKVVTELYQEPSDYVQTRAWSGTNGHGYEFEFKGEDDTLGNLLQSLMYNHYIRDKKMTEHGREVTYVGYVCPHPLEELMVLRIVFAEEAPLSEYIEAFAERCRAISSILQTIEIEWLGSNK